MFTQVVQNETQALLQRAVQELFMHDNLQLDSQAPADSVPQIERHPSPTQFLSQPILQVEVQPPRVPQPVHP